MFDFGQLFDYVISNIPVLSDLKTEDGETCYGLAKMNSSEEISETLKSEREEYVESMEKKLETEAKEAENEVQEKPIVQVDKTVDVDLDSNDQDVEVRLSFFPLINSNFSFSE